MLTWWSTKACEVAQALYSLGRYAEAEDWARRAAAAGASEDVITQAMSRQVLAKAAVRLGQFGTGRALAAEALVICEPMQAPITQGEACLDAAEVLWLAGDNSEAIRLAERAAGYFGSKGATGPGQRARRLAAAVAATLSGAAPAVQGSF